ncbi:MULTISPECIES: hypothetical protein [unclassified Streptomyces]|uniref:hypothetical protein n=1 Tax=unclassified Streptomyces TaxID=2593676 RepID=UPI0033DA2568
MGNRADEYGSDVEIYRKPLTDTIFAETRTAAPEHLLALLDTLGLERKTTVTAGPVYVWHEVPGHLSEDEQKKAATRPIPALLQAGYVVNIPDDLFDPTAYQEAVAVIRNPSRPAVVPPAAAQLASKSPGRARPASRPATPPAAESHSSRRSP